MPGKPDFLIIGAMKSGTTVLYEFICRHPLVNKAAEKEIHYFSLHPYRGIKWYQDQFESKYGYKTGEASPTYFHMANSNGLPMSIKEYVPDVKIILIVRDPIERSVSHLYHYQKINKIQELQNFSVNDFFSLSFDEALKQTTSIGFYLHNALTFSCYARPFQTYLSVFDRKSILVINNVELLTNPQETMCEVFNFLCLSPLRANEFTKFKYSTGSNLNSLSKATFNKLAQLLYPDYERFCQLAQVEYKPVAYPENSSIKNELRDTQSVTCGSDDVAVGKNGWLFLKGGQNDVISSYRSHPLDKTIIKSWHELIRNRHEKCRLRGIQYLHLMAPNKLSVYPEHYNGPLENFSRHPANAIMSSANERDSYIESIINPIPYFNKMKQSLQIYWKTDTHWTYLGCYCAYQLICSKLGILPNKELLTRPYTEGTIALDLGSKCDPIVKEKARYYTVLDNAKRVYENEIVKYKEKHKLENDIGLHVGSYVVFYNEKAKNKQTVILFGDSFSEYRPQLLTGMLAETFREVHFIWSSALDWHIINKVGPNIVLTELVERFMRRVPKDDFRLERFAKKQLTINM